MSSRRSRTARRHATMPAQAARQQLFPCSRGPGPATERTAPCRFNARPRGRREGTCSRAASAGRERQPGPGSPADRPHGGGLQGRQQGVAEPGQVDTPHGVAVPANCWTGPPWRARGRSMGGKTATGIRKKAGGLQGGGAGRVSGSPIGRAHDVAGSKPISTPPSTLLDKHIGHHTKGEEAMGASRPSSPATRPCSTGSAPTVRHLARSRATWTC